MLKYKLRKIGRKKIIFWSATMLIFLISMTSIIRYYAYSASFSPANSGNSGINNTTVYVNDWEKEYNYYMSLNYTEIISPTAVPSGTNTNRYNNENLIPFEITYDGQDINNSSLIGYVSYLNTERQSKYVYYKYFVLKDNKVKIPLIDNPFSSRPMVNGTGYGFNGWVCNATNTSDINVGDTENKVDICSRATLSYDDDYYQRYITIDLNGLDYTKGIQLYLNAFWIPARVYTLTTNNNLNNSGLYAKTMQQITKTDQDVRVYYQEYVFYSLGFKNGVTYYVRQGNNYVQNTAPYNAGTTYYIRENNNYRQAVQNDFDRLYRWEERNASVGTRSDIGYTNTSSLYYKVNSNSNNNPLFYTSGGAVCGENNCGTVGYKLIQTTDSYTNLYHDYDISAYNTNPEQTNPQEGDRRFNRCTIGGTNSATCEVNNNGINFDNFHYFVTRDTNIVHLTSNNNVSYNSNYMSNNNPFTVSSCPFGNTCTIRTINNGTFNANNDVRFENVRTSGSNGSNFNANNHNVKIGRNINGANPTNNFVNEFVGSTGKYTIIIESGSYNNITLANGNATGIAAVGHFGSDYDRVSGDDIDGVNGGNNHKFLVKNRLRATNPTSNNYKNSGDPMVPFSDMYVYSGCIACDNNYRWKNNIDDSIYMGFAAENVQWTSLSYLTIYGGYIKAIYGGSGFNSQNVTNVNATSVHMLGGTVGTIFGGARKRGLYGHRIISISGGNIVFNIFGVSNSYDGSTGEAGGISNDNSLVYIGGTALIGATPDEGTNYTGQYYTVNAPTGSVFGGGAGGANYPGTGTVKNSHVVINGGKIKGDVFGGGNYGATGDTFDEETTTKIDIYAGTIQGNVYGGANRNGAGNSPANSICSCGAGNSVCINYNYYYVATGSVAYYGSVPRNTYYYNGSTITSSGNRAVTCYTWGGCTTFNRVGIGTAYNSGTTYYNQYYQNVSPNTCTVSTGLVAMKHNITITMTGGTVEHSVYGGANITGTAYANIKLDMIGGTVEQDVFGGGRGETQNNAHNGNIVMGNIEVNAKGTKIRDVYGGSALGRVNGNGTANEEDKTGYTTKVNISAGDIRDVYGCGMGADSGNPNNPYAYPYTNGQTTVTVTGGSMSNVYGGNNSSGKAAYPTQVELLGGTITGNAFGGGNNVGHGVTNIHLNGTTINTYVDPADNVVKGGNVFGGSNNNGTVTLTNVVIDSGTVHNVFGGNNLGGNADETRVIFNSANISENVYGSGLRASSRVTNVTINSGEVKNVFGGGLNAGVTEKSKVLIKNNAKVTEGVYGGSNASGTVANSYVYVSGTNGKIGNVFGGNNIGGKTTNSHVYIGGGSVTNVYGGGNQVNTGSTNVYVYSGTMDKVFGGDNNVPEPDPGDGDPTYTNSTDVYVYGGTVPYVFGGSNIQGRVDEAKVTIEDNPPACTVDNSAAIGEVVDPCYENSTRTVTDVFGGNNEGGLVNDTIVNIKDTAYLNDVFGGGNEAKVLNSTTVNMYAGNVYNLYGGGNRSFVGDAVEGADGSFQTGGEEGKTEVYVANGTIRHNVYGSGNASFVYGETYVYIGDEALAVLGNINEPHITIGDSVFGGSETNADDATTYTDSFEGVHGDSHVYISASNYENKNITISHSVYGSGNNSKTSGNSYVYINDFGTTSSVMKLDSIQRAKYVYLTDSVLELMGSRDRALITTYIYGLIRIEHLYMLGSGSDDAGTTLHMNAGTAYLFNYYSGKMDTNSLAGYNNDNFVPQETDIDEDTGVASNTNSNNKLFMHTNIVFSVTTTAEADTSHNNEVSGPVNGMTYLGMYTATGSTYTYGIYNPNLQMNQTLDNSTLTGIGTDAYTFVYGKHSQDPEVQIENNGFYSHYRKEDETEKIVTRYVGVRPDNENYYKWILGDEPLLLVVDLFATNSTVEGAYLKTIDLNELKNGDDSWKDAKMKITGIDTTGFLATIDVDPHWETYLVDKTKVPTVATSSSTIGGKDVTDANRYFSLSMGTTTSGWLKNYRTNIYDNEDMFDAEHNWNDGDFNSDYFLDITSPDCTSGTGKCTGDLEYTYDSTTTARSLAFWLHYSKNLDFSFATTGDDELTVIPLGTVYIQTEFENPHGDPTHADELQQSVKIQVNISLYHTNNKGYASAIDAGKKYEMFSNHPNPSITGDSAVSIYQMLTLDLSTDDEVALNSELNSANTLYAVDKVENGIKTTAAYRYIKSDYEFPEGTKITMLDLKNNEQYYYIVGSGAAERSLDGSFYKYRLTDFTKMGNTDVNDPLMKFDDDMNGSNSSKYFTPKSPGSEAGVAVEEFIFTVDFSEAVGHTNAGFGEHYVYMEIARDTVEVATNNVISSTSKMFPNGEPMSSMKYTIVNDSNSAINTKGWFLDKNGQPVKDNNDEPLPYSFYKRDETTLELDTDLVSSSNAQDTKYDDYKLGAKITVMQAVKDEHGNVTDYIPVTTNLFGSVFKIGQNEYYPQTDGTIRVPMAGRITNVLSDIKMDFANSDMEFGDYKLVVETFASYDGLYYGDFTPTEKDLYFTLLNDEYGIDVSLPPVQVTHDSNDGKDKEGSLVLNYTLTTKNGLANPNVKVHLERRTYSSMFATTYEPVSLSGIATSLSVADGNNVMNNTCFSPLGSTSDCQVYSLKTLSNTLLEDTANVNLTLKPGPDASDLANPNAAKWKSGTYRVYFDMYDGDSYIGSVYEYLIIRSLKVDEEIEGS